MYVQVITYSLEGISEEEYLDVANRLAPGVAGVPGLLAKIWLENPGGNRYGGIYFWDDLESMDRFNNSNLFEGGTEEFTDLVAEEFGILENLTAMTQPVLEILEPRRGPAPPAPTRPRAATARKTMPPAAKRAPDPETRPLPAKAPSTKATAKKATAKKAPARAVKKAPVKKAPAKKAPVKKAATKAAAATKAPTTRAATKAPARKTTKKQGG